MTSYHSQYNNSYSVRGVGWKKKKPGLSSLHKQFKEFNISQNGTEVNWTMRKVWALRFFLKTGSYAGAQARSWSLLKPTEMDFTQTRSKRYQSSWVLVDKQVTLPCTTRCIESCNLHHSKKVSMISPTPPR